MRAKKAMLKSELYSGDIEIVSNFYDTVSLDDFADNDMISGAEEGFMLGYLDA